MFLLLYYKRSTLGKKENDIYTRCKTIFLQGKRLDVQLFLVTFPLVVCEVTGVRVKLNYYREYAVHFTLLYSNTE